MDARKMPDLLAKAFWILLLAYCGILAEDVSMAYQTMDSSRIPVAMAEAKPTDREKLEEEFDRRFPRPPLFPPPPPSLATNTNAILREAIFNNIKDKLKGDAEADGFENTIEKPHEGSGGESSTDWSEFAYKYCPSLGGIGIQEWPVGPKGPRGDSGPAGPAGVKGRRGKKGKQGPVGPPGPGGPMGPVGLIGLPGPAGAPGLSGRDGHKGDQGHTGPRGYPGLQGSPGLPGTPGHDGTKGNNGIPGLIVFPDAKSMYGVELEGLVAYRSDVKILYFRDNITWRPIRITRCGDGILDRDVGEECDDGNDDQSDECVRCKKAFCGDGTVQAGKEDCDGRNFGGKPTSCAAWRKGTTGTLMCTYKCEVSYRRCRYEFR